MRYPLKMDNQTNILEVNNLNVFYGKFQAVNNLSKIGSFEKEFNLL